MGYILPIQHFTYNDYQKRIQPVKVNHYHIRGPYPVTKIQNQQLPYGPTAFQQQKGSEGFDNDKGQCINTYV